MENNINYSNPITPSEFYRKRRPENFSDSKVGYDIELTKEHFAFELENVTKNQKQDEFESLCRKLVEKFIAPNIIPQTGPTGGGDGKTDTETYPISQRISERWFIPENGWSNNEKWAFAFSAKKDWKAKVRKDIESIISTKRDYTKIYFVTNQTPSSKQIKDAQDKLSKQYSIEIIILNGIWIIEKIFANKLFDIAVDTLNLSSVYKKKNVFVGKNDAERSKIIEELEIKIQNPNRYLEYDFQLVEDALEAAILARQLERPREEIEGKLDRAIRFCKKVNLNRQWIRIYYQKAWTYLYYFDDYPAFIDAYNHFKEYFPIEPSASELEYYVNLFNSLRGLCATNCNLEDYKISIDEEKKILYNVLEIISNDNKRPSSSLIAKIDLTIQRIVDNTSNGLESDSLFQSLVKDFTKSIGLLDFPFEGFHQVFEELGKLFPTNVELDKLIDLIASIAEKRSSELTSGKIYFQRGIDKYTATLYKESIVYFGKALWKLAKEESEKELYFTLKGLGHAFNDIGLLWASNNCFLSANYLSLKSWYQKGILDRRIFSTTKQLAINELLLGRIPAFLSWYELLKVISERIDIEEKDDEPPTLVFLDALFAVRLLNTENNIENFSLFPELLESQNLMQSHHAVLFKLGYWNEILDDFKSINISCETELIGFYQKVAGQPFRKQIKYETQFFAENTIIFKSIALGCIFEYSFEKDIELMLAAETFAAFFENFLSTSLKLAFPKTEKIIIQLIRNQQEPLFKFRGDDASSKYTIEIDKFSFPQKLGDEVWSEMVNFFSQVLAENFFINDIQTHLKNLFENEELNQRLTFTFEHRNFTINALGDSPKLFYSSWIQHAKKFELKKPELQVFSFDDEEPDTSDFQKGRFDEIRHDDNKVISIINEKLWDKAKWIGFGPFNIANEFFGVFIAFEDGNSGQAIFDNWIEKYGKEDKNEIIKVTIIKGVNKKHPYWYKVHICANIKADFFKSEERFISVIARIHQMTPDNPKNLTVIEHMTKQFQKIMLCPAMIEKGGKEIAPYFKKGIIIKTIEIKNAWEIGINHIESAAIRETDDPIIPLDIIDAPVLEILNKRKHPR